MTGFYFCLRVGSVQLTYKRPGPGLQLVAWRGVRSVNGRIIRQEWVSVLELLRGSRRTVKRSL